MVNSDPVEKQELQGLMTDKEFEQKFGISQRTRIRWEVERMGPPPVKVGRRTFYRIKTVNEWIESRERKPIERSIDSRTRRRKSIA